MILPSSACSFSLCLSDVITFIIDTTVKEEAGSPCLGTLLSFPPFAPLCLLWLARLKLRDCVQMCLERGQPLCPGRTCGLGVFTLALFQAVSHTACWRLSLLDDNAQPSSHKRGQSQVEVTPAVVLIHILSCDSGSG